MIDPNKEHAGMAVTNDANLTPTDLLVDETTGRLLIAITHESVVTAPRDISIDENQEYVALASDGTDPKPVITKSDGVLLCDIDMEI